VIVYVSSPYSAPTEEERLANVQVAIEAGRQLMEMGHQPFLPTLSHFVDPSNTLFEYDRWMEWCLCFLPHCDSLLLLGTSKGCLMERDWANHLNIPVYDGVDEFDPVENHED
jgi:hypothetical protein